MKEKTSEKGRVIAEFRKASEELFLVEEKEGRYSGRQGKGEEGISGKRMPRVVVEKILSEETLPSLTGGNLEKGVG